MSLGALAAIFGSSFLVSLTGALSPGPLTTLAVREGVRRGFWSGPLLAMGHGAIELALVVGLALGLNQVFDNDAVAAAIALVGGLFLLWLGWQVVRTAPRQELAITPASPSEASSATPRLPAHGEASPAAPRVHSLRAAGALATMGVAMSLSNPFWFVWWASIGSAYIVQALDQGAAGVASFYGGHVLADLGWLSLIAFALTTGRRLMTRWAYRSVLMGCGAFLLGLGVWFLSSAARYLV